MKEGSRSGPFGCLILKKKGVEPKEKRRKRLILHNSESDEDLFVTPPPKVIHNNTSRDEVEIDRKRKSGGVLYRDDARHDRHKLLEVGTERKRSRIDDVGCSSRMLEERRTEIGRNGVLISKARVPVVERREFASDREHCRFDRSRDFPIKQERESVGVRGDKFGANDGKTIRVQGKNGVLKLMPSNKNKVGTSENCFGTKKEVEDRKGSKSVECPNGKTPVSSQLHLEKSHEKLYPVVVKEEKQPNSLKKLSHAQNEVHDRRARLMESSLLQESKSLSPCNLKKEVCNKKQKSVASEPMKPCMSSRLDKGEVKRATDTDKQVLQKQINETSLCQELKDVGSCSSKKEVCNKKQKLLTSEPCTSSGRKEEVKRGNGTEKQLLREQIREMLVNAGWTIDLRPRRNRDYQDSVYINPSGTEFWSITKAYYAFQKNLEDKGKGQKNSGNFSSSALIPDDVLSMLTRKTRKKMERETKLQQKADRGSKNLSSEKKLKKKHVNLKTSGVANEEKIKSHVTQDGKSLKMRIKGNSMAEPNSENSAKSKIPSSSNIGSGNREKSKQSGRALLVRGSGNGLNMEHDDFVPYTGKRTVLSWLIDMETVPLSGKVQYMNKKRTRAMQEGWITRDGIHCRCCSKILTISKFELHAGSKLHQPFQNIILENGVSLFQCQLDAWNRQDKSARCGFHYIDVDGDDPNDDTCGICGDGGDLICCDGCPSTFHQSCLNIQMLPSGDWLCPNCSCKFCGGVDLTGQEEDGKLCSCHLCEKKYHRLCRQQTDINFIGSDSSRSSFCGKACEELFQELQKLLGVKHELDADFSWTLIQRFNVDSDASCHGPSQKAEFNSKIAVALTVMDECFLPVIDQRSGVNLIQNVLYNVGSNFSRVNYSGFYTAVLERGDEIMAAASIRIHGTRLAEMPFIGTRHIYRRQGMCRRLLHAVESALSSLKVQKLVIPAVSELMHTWTTVFGFKPLEESHKQEVKTLNILVFPSTDLLQKPLLSDSLNGNMTKSTDENNDSLPDVSENTDIGSVEADMCTNCDPAVNNGVSSVGSGLKHPTSSTCDTSDVMNNPSDASLETLPDGALDMGADCDHAVDDGVSSLGTSPREPTGSTYDTSAMMNNLSDASLETVPGTSSACLALESQFRPHCGVLCDSILETGKDLISCSSVDSKLQNLADDKLCEDDVEAAAVELDLSPSHDTSRKDNDHLDTDSGNGSRATDKGLAERNPDWNEQNVQKLENSEDLCSVEPGTCAPDKGTDYSCDRNCEASSIQNGLRDLADSLHETCDIIDKPTDATIVSIHDGSSKESGPDTNNLLRHMDNDTKVHVDCKPSSGLFVESKLQKSTGDIVPEAKREAMAVECDLHPFDGTSLRHRNKVNSSCLNAFSANCKSGGDHVQSNSKLDEHVHTVECKSEIDLFQLGSLACDYNMNTGVSVTDPGWNDPSGPTYAASGMKDNPSGFGHRSAHSGERDLEPKLLLPCMNIKLDMHTKMSTDSKLLNLNEYDAVEENVEGASDECTNTDSNYSNTVTGNIFQPANKKLVGRNPNFKENNIHALGCISLEVYHVPSDVSTQSTSLESTKREINEVKTEVLKVYHVTSDASALSTSQERTERDVNEIKTEDMKVPSHL